MLKIRAFSWSRMDGGDMKDMDSMAVAEEAMAKIKKGAFLTVKAADALNTMTIGWALFGPLPAKTHLHDRGQGFPTHFRDRRKRR